MWMSVGYATIGLSTLLLLPCVFCFHLVRNFVGKNSGSALVAGQLMMMKTDYFMSWFWYTMFGRGHTMVRSLPL